MSTPAVSGCQHDPAADMLLSKQRSSTAVGEYSSVPQRHKHVSTHTLHAFAACILLLSCVLLPLRYWIILAERILRQFVATPALGRGERFVQWMRDATVADPGPVTAIKLAM